MFNSVVGVLAGQARVLHGQAGAVGAVAAGAGRDIAILDAAAEDALAQQHQILVLGKAALGLLRAEPGGDVLHLLVGQRGGETLHHRILAHAALELLQLLDQVLGMLLRQCRISHNGRVAIRSVACCAYCSKACSSLRQIKLGVCLRRRGRFSCRNGWENRCCQKGSHQHRGEQLHIEGLLLGALNRTILQ
ncbi:hypothetical protein D3C71_1604890 [compost metagenome]